jgi:AcrR family transcriptional regulator
MASVRQAPAKKRRIPSQARSTETVALILEAAAQILERDGLAGFTTNALAERAGVSIGTVYQYFGDKNAVLLALAEQQMKSSLDAVRRALAPPAGLAVEERVRAVVRVVIHAFGGRARARKAVVQAILAQGLGIEMMAPVAAFLALDGSALGRDAPRLTQEQVFVLSRAILGTVRAAVLEERPFLRSRLFEDEVVRLVLAYVGAVSAAPR